jgi:Na+-transporting methylmalonyl-CoA/oxaloacetate decarboxylase gamma subunit
MNDLGFGLSVTVAGLAIVFGLLTVLWLLLSLALRLDRGPSAATAPPERRPDRAASSPLDPRLVAAISIAVLRHAEERRRQAAPAMRSHTPGSLLFASHWVGAGRVRQGQPWRRKGR